MGMGVGGTSVLCGGVVVGGSTFVENPPAVKVDVVVVI